MYTAFRVKLDNLTEYAYTTLYELCQASGRLYNVGLYNSRQQYFKDGSILSYEDNYHLSKMNENYKILQAGCAQQTLKRVSFSMKSFDALQDLVAKGEYPEDAVRLPKYKRGERLYPFWCSSNAITIKDRKFKIPFSQEFMKTHEAIWVNIPNYVDVNTVKEVMIKPYDDDFYITFTCNVEPENLKFDSTCVLGIDVGVSNLMTCVSTIGDSFIIDGRKLKSYNHYYNKEYARRKSIATVDAIGHRKVESGDRIPTTKAMRRMNRKRDNYMTDYIRKACRMVINYCLDNKVGCIVIGRNKKWKHKVNMHKDDNQNFVYIPYTKLYTQLAFLCEKYGIEYIEVNEAYTSQSSCLDFDVIPKYRRGKHHKFSGSRVHRGVYVSRYGLRINADSNSAGNMIRKCKQDVLDSKAIYELCKGLLASPLRLTVV